MTAPYYQDGLVTLWHGDCLEIADWLQADDQIIKPMVKASADRYAAEKKIERRPPSDC